MGLLGTNAASILKKSAKVKAVIYKLRDDLTGINLQLMEEASSISNKIQELQDTQILLSDESGENTKVIKNIDKILGN